MKILKNLLFWIISLTWGGIMTWLGVIVAIVLICTGHKPKLFYQNIYFEVGTGWGGFEMGAFFIVNKNSSSHIRQHEAGHGLQNLVLGIFMPFLVSIPSAIRYWRRVWLVKCKHKSYSDLPDYDSVWFEKSATKLGEKYYPLILKEV
jgi:hypothetical protein